MEFSDDERIAAWQREDARVRAGLPPPNFENPPRRHHHVPAMYLTRFAASSGPRATPRLVRLDARVGLGSAKVIGVHDACVETDFYTVDSDDLRRRHEVEHVLSVFEATAALAFANLDRGGPDHFPDSIDRRSLSQFMALQHARGHEMRNFLERASTEVSRMVLRVAASDPNRVRRFLEGQGDDASDHAVTIAMGEFRDAAESVSVAPHRNEVAAAILRNAVDTAPYFFNRRWTLLRSTSPLITTDRPVVLVPDPRVNSGHAIGVGTAHAILFVLDRYRAFLLSHPKDVVREGVLDIDAARTRWVNSTVANHARRWIFHHPDDRPLDGIPFEPSSAIPLPPGS